MSNVSASDLGSLSDSEKQEITSFLDTENSKQRVQMQIHEFTNSCFKNCVKSVDDAALTSEEEQCLSNCVNSFLDANIRIVKNLQNTQ